MESSKITKDIVVFYHGQCTDGFGAAWSAWKKFGDSADYIGVKLGISPPDGLKGKEIYTLDFTYPSVYGTQLLNENKSLVSLDHHGTAKEHIKISTEYVFDQTHSGAVLSWNYFHPENELPKVLKYIEDMDLWKFNFPETKALGAYLDSLDLDFMVWDKAITNIEREDKFKEVISQGELILKFEDKLIAKISERAELVEFEGFKAYAVNSPVFDSQIGNNLYKKLPPLGIVWYRDNNRLKFSLRSDGTVDVSEMAKKYGGGGHKASSGFALPLESELPWKVIK